VLVELGDFALGIVEVAEDDCAGRARLGARVVKLPSAIGTRKSLTADHPDAGSWT